MVLDQVFDPQADFGLVEFSFAGEGYLEAMGIGLLSGRTLDRRDMEIASVMAEDPDAMIELPVVINRTMAEEFWPESEALGELVRPASAHEYFRARVVGIVENVRQWGPDQDPLPEMYFPHTAELWGAISAQLIIRAGTDPEALVPLVRAAVDELDSTLPLAASITMAKILKDSTGGRRFSMLLVSLFAVTALLLIIAGTYGVVSYSVSQRTHEIGVRMTLGANKGRVARQFLRQVGVLMGFGLALGILGACVVALIIRSMVYGISAISPLQMSLAASVMVLVALAATAGPVFRAAGVDPLEAMRAD
jgi:hypothetical protein